MRLAGRPAARVDRLPPGGGDCPTHGPRRPLAVGKLTAAVRWQPGGWKTASREPRDGTCACAASLLVGRDEGGLRADPAAFVRSQARQFPRGGCAAWRTS